MKEAEIEYIPAFIIRILVIFFIVFFGVSYTEAQPPIRKTVELSENWRFLMDVRNIGEKEKWYAENFSWGSASGVNVPGAWDLLEAGMWQYEGLGWYKTNINPSDFTPGKRSEITVHRVM